MGKDASRNRQGRTMSAWIIAFFLAFGIAGGIFAPLLLWPDVVGPILNVLVLFAFAVVMLRVCVSPLDK